MNDWRDLWDQVRKEMTIIKIQNIEVDILSTMFERLIEYNGFLTEV